MTFHVSAFRPLPIVVMMAMVLQLIAVSAFSQSILYPGYIDPGAYPVVVAKFRLEGPGRSILPIDPSTIRFLEDGNPVAATIECPERPIVASALGLGLELSLDDNFTLGQTLLSRFVAAIRFRDEGHRASVWSLSTFIDHPQSLTPDSAAVQRTVLGLSRATWPFNGTALYETMYRAIDEVAGQPEQSRCIVFFTTGVNNTKNYDRSRGEVHQRAMEKGVAVYVVLIGGSDAGRDAMEFIANGTGGFAVDATDPDALERVASSFRRQPVDYYWCMVRYRSPHCANGEDHVLEARVENVADTLVAQERYTAPLRPGELRSLPVFLSPTTFLAATGDSIRCVIGLHVQDTMSMDPFVCEILRDGIGRISALIPEQWTAVVISETDSSSRLRLQPPPATVALPGRILVVTLTAPVLKKNPSLRLNPAIGPTGCLQPVPTIVPTLVAAELDTVLSDPGLRVSLNLDIAAMDIPEGITSARFVIRIAARDLPDGQVGQGMFLSQRNWKVIHDRQVTLNEWMYHTWEIEGPPMGQPGKLAELLFTLHPAARRIPVYLDSLVINRYAPVPLSVVGNGLILVRDSCRNNIILLNGLSVSKPYPNPALSHVTFQVTSLHTGSLEVELLDALGRIVLPTREHSITTGVRHSIHLDLLGLRSGAYLARFRQNGAIVVHPIILVDEPASP